MSRQALDALFTARAKSLVDIVLLVVTLGACLELGASNPDAKR